MPGWENETSTSNCMKAMIICHVSCLSCSGQRQDQCDTCHTGFALSVVANSVGFCLPCHEKCKTCTGPADNQCLTCVDSDHGVSGTNSCECCHPSCKTCQASNDATQCLTCPYDRDYIEVTTGPPSKGNCLCKAGLWEDASGRCMPTCPLNSVYNDTTKKCDPVNYSTVWLTFANDFTVGSTPRVDLSLISCHMPQTLNRYSFDWAVYNGLNTFLQIDKFAGFESNAVGQDITISFYVKTFPDEKNASVFRPGTVFSFHQNYALRDEAIQQFDNNENCQQAHLMQRKFIIDFSVTSCGHFKLSIDGKTRAEVDPGETGAPGTLSEYRHIGIKFLANANQGKTNWESIKVISNGSNGSINWQNDIDDWFTEKWTPITSIPSEESEFFIGSYLGVTNFFRGFIGNFQFTNETTALARASISSWVETCPLGWYTSGSMCLKCHETCTACTDGTACSVCHPTCSDCADKTQLNPGKGDECISCFCGADVDNGHCVTKDSHIGTADNAHLRCYEGCDDCIGPGEHECVYCSANYELVEGCPGTCRWCDENACDEDGYPVCGNRGANWSGQSECDCHSGQYFDGTWCRECADGCT